LNSASWGVVVTMGTLHESAAGVQKRQPMKGYAGPQWEGARACRNAVDTRPPDNRRVSSHFFACRLPGVRLPRIVEPWMLVDILRTLAEIQLEALGAPSSES
jgi:hypothetical protein